MTQPAPLVEVIGWDHRSGVALVDRVRVRVRRSGSRTRRICDRHGSGPDPHCTHLEALAETPPPPEKEINRR